MIFSETPLAGAYVIEPELLRDERGFFARSYCDAEFADHGLHTQWPQCNLSFNAQRGTLRGMHYQVAPYGEVKLVRCIAGAIFDLIVDLRADSPSYLQSFGVELSAENRTMLYIPQGFAHGFLTLADKTEVFYHMGASYVPNAARGLRWDDPRLGIAWPEAVQVISDRDATYPDFQGESAG